MLTFSAYYYAFQKDNEVIQGGKRIALFITLLLHVSYLIVRTMEFNHPPITNKFEIFTVLAFSIAFSYFILELLTDIRNTGAFILIFSLLFQIISSLFIEDLIEVKEILRSRLLGLHVVSALLGYSGFTLSAVYGALFILLYKKIKLNKFDRIFEKMPSLERLEKLSFYSVNIGFALLTVSIIIGVVWLPIAFENYSYTDPKLIIVGIVWLLYLSGIILKVVRHWYGKKVVYFSLIGFVLAMLAMVISSLIPSSFHTFTN
jgi:ABC-type uncharacterized transport system permease subunit